MTAQEGPSDASVAASWDRAVNPDELLALLGAAESSLAELRLGLEASRRVGVAIGIMMFRYKIAERHRLGVLSEVSENSRFDLVDVADYMIRAGSALTTAPRLTIVPE